MKICLHIGYPKTGSTFLQFSFFNKLSQNFIGRPYGLKDYYIEKLLSNSNNKNFQKYKKKIINHYLSKLEKNKINILSVEDFLKFSFFTKKSQNNPHQNIKRLKEVFSKIGSVKIIFVIRSHKDILRSFYDEYYLNDWKNNNIKHNDIINYLKKKRIKRLDNFFLTFKFYKTYNLLKKNFGQNNVKLLFYEDLKYNFKNFNLDILNFLKINFDLKIENKKFNSSLDKNSYLTIFKRIKKRITLKNINIFEFKNNFCSVIKAFIEIYQRKKINEYINDLDLIEKELKLYYQKDLLKFKSKLIQYKFKKYNYF